MDELHSQIVFKSISHTLYLNPSFTLDCVSVRRNETCILTSHFRISEQSDESSAISLNFPDYGVKL